MLEQLLGQLNTSVMAILVLLIQKEIITEEEFTKTRLFVQHIEDQESAARKEELLRILKEKNPSIYNLFKKMDDEALE